MKGTDCFIVNGAGELEDDLVIIFCNFLSLWLIMGYNNYAVYQTYSSLSTDAMNSQIIRRRVLHLFLYPAILFFCYLPVKKKLEKNKLFLG